MDSGTCITGMPNARYNCCLDAAMSVIEGRWKCTIICMLMKYGPMRFSELERKIGDVSSRILSKQLKELEADGMVIRTVYPDRKLKVSYSLSERGESILPILADLAEWGARNNMVQVIVPTAQHSQTLTATERVRGPSNSQRKTPCHVPRTRRPSDTMMFTDGPTHDVLRCAWEFPSACLYSSRSGNALSRPDSRSVLTSGSAFSFIVMPAVVCMENTVHIPSVTPLPETMSRTRSVMSTICSLPVLTDMTECPDMCDGCGAGISMKSAIVTAMAYRLVCIGDDRSRELRTRCSELNLYTMKADINGVCVQLYTEKKDYIDMWSDNFYHMSDNVRSHARIYCMDDPDTDLHAEYDVATRTMFLFNFDYYGWVKSIALGIAGNILEDAHSIYSVHGAALDLDGKGVTLIAPSKTGKTTQSWGLLRGENTHLITDDWYFVSFGSGRPTVEGSEKNCYIDADIGDVWEEYRPLVKEVRFDNKGRGIGNVRWVTGEGSVIRSTSMRYVFLLKRDYDCEAGVTPMDAEDALEYLRCHDYCNPHQLVRDDAKMALREEFFRRYLSECETFMVNTTGTAEETQASIREVLRDRCGI